MLLNKVYRRTRSQKGLPRGIQHRGLKFHADCEVMSRTANAGDPNAERRIESLLLSMPPSVHASSYSCLLLPMSPTELPTNNPASCEPQGAPRRSSRLLAFTPRGRCESSVADRGRQCQLSISTPPSPLHAHGLACQDAGSCTEYAACTKPFCTVRWTGRGSPVPGLNHRRCFKDEGLASQP